MKKPLALPIFYENKETEKLSLIGENAPVEKCDKRIMYFFKIDALAVYYVAQKPTKYTRIILGADRFVCALPLKDVLKLIQENQ